MDSWDPHTASPSIKYEDSPAESLLSTPDEMYPSLFGSSPATTVNPLDMMSPKSFTEEEQPDLKMLTNLTVLAQTSLTTPSAAPTTAGTPEPEKKPVKKRKSWGQVLPEPKTNLPPRYDALTPQMVSTTTNPLTIAQETRQDRRREGATPRRTCSP